MLSKDRRILELESDMRLIKEFAKSIRKESSYNLEFFVKIMYDRIRVNNDNLFFDVFILNSAR